MQRLSSTMKSPLHHLKPLNWSTHNNMSTEDLATPNSPGNVKTARGGNIALKQSLKVSKHCGDEGDESVTPKESLVIDPRLRRIIREKKHLQ